MLGQLQRLSPHEDKAPRGDEALIARCPVSILSWMHYLPAITLHVSYCLMSTNALDPIALLNKEWLWKESRWPESSLFGTTWAVITI